MAKKNKAVYAPGELDRVRGKLGEIDEGEAKRVAQLLGGEVGTERSEEQEAERHKKPVRRENVDLVVGKNPPPGRPSRRIDVASDDEGRGYSKPIKPPKPDPGDDPSKPLKIGYFERIKMDRYASQIDFEIKNSLQILVSVFSLFSEPTDYINPRFVTKRMNDYYGRIEQLVTATRSIFPKKNAKRNNQLKRASPFIYSVLDTIRSWNIEAIAGEMAGIQVHPRAARLSEFSNIIRMIYKPLFILEKLDMETHIKGSYKVLYKILYIENPMDAKEKFQDIIRNALVAFADIRRDIRLYLYPMLMKMISDRWIPYERFFIERHKRYMAFLNTTEADQLIAVDLTPQQIENVDVEAIKEGMNNEQGEEGDNEVPDDDFPEEEEDPNDPEVIARKAREEAARAESKALERGLAALEVLFPKAGWDRLTDFPDLYPYFADTYNLRRGFELIAPTDPLQQISILMHILEDIFFAMRYVKFGTITAQDGTRTNIEEYLGDIINYWRSYIDNGFIKEYLPRLVEYCRVLENSSESRTSPFVRKTANELHWVKRLYFLPYYKFESIGPPPFQKQDITPIYTEIRVLRKYLTSIAIGIEMGVRKGGAEAKAACDGIGNPWDNYNFEVPNAISRRLEALLAPGKKNNASLIFFSLSVTTVLDYIINNEESWTYRGRPGPLFRSIKGEGITPMFGVDNKLDADKIFKDSLKKKEQQ
jgi:hypothetical protein